MGFRGRFSQGMAGYRAERAGSKLSKSFAEGRFQDCSHGWDAIAIMANLSHACATGLKSKVSLGFCPRPVTVYHN